MSHNAPSIVVSHCQPNGSSNHESTSKPLVHDFPNISKLSIAVARNVIPTYLPTIILDVRSISSSGTFTPYNICLKVPEYIKPDFCLVK